MINVKVKTLDSQNHDFTVQEEITVRQFKEHIAEAVNVVADLQRIIYCGRLLNDEKKLKDYDVNGKVVHLVIRPPPGERPENSPLDNPQVATPQRRGPGRFMARSMDGILNAMAMHVANGTPQAAAPSLNPSSTLCMNRITVARYMLQCANNIVNHLDDPQTPVNNVPMDILGQQTLESTILEVGISAVSDVDQVDNIMQAFQGAVNAALRQNAPPNMTVGQDSIQIITPAFISRIPDPSGSGSASSTSTNSPASSSSNSSISFDGTDAADGPTPAEEPIPTENTEPTASSSTPSQTTQTPPADSTTPNGSNSRQQTTSTQTLATVVQEMRTVQGRLEPYLQQYYDILQNDPAFSAEDTTGRENAQRVFDRVSEAMHYMSHAQHAISDLMLDLSTTAPRHLCCRPILIEQSAFVSSGFGMPNISIRADVNPSPQATSAPAAPQSNQPQTPQSNGAPPPPPPPPAHHQHQHIATIPIIVQHTSNGPPSADAAQGAAAALVGVDGIQENTIARFFQSLLGPGSGNVELRPRGQTQTPPSTSSQSQERQTETTTTATGPGRSQSTPSRPPLRTAASTLPTTSTQTRSTARPQVHVTSILQPPQMRNVRPVPSNIFSAFDRFLPCNSHHIRDMAGQHHQQQQNGTASSNPPGGNRQASVVNIGGGGNLVSSVTIQPPMFIRRRPNTDSARAATNSSQNRQPSTTSTPDGEDRDLQPVYNAGELDEMFLNNARNDLREIISRKYFNNAAITIENLEEGIAEIVFSLNDFLEPLTNYQHPDYCIRKSVLMLIRAYLKEMLNLLRCDDGVSAADERFPVNFNRSLQLMGTNLVKILLQSNQRRQDIKKLFKSLYCKHVKDLNQQQPVGRILTFWLKICCTALDTKFTSNNLNDIIEYLVIKAPMTTNDEDVPMDVEEINLVEQMEATPSTSGSSTNNHIIQKLTSRPEEMDEDVVTNSESWHSDVPASWIGTLSGDLNEQQRITDSHAHPLSDAHLDGMTKKRRKLITDSRPTNPIPDLINGGVRRVIQNSGFQSQTPTDQISVQISGDTGLQNSFREAMHSNIKDRLRTDPNFDPKKHANSSSYFK